MTHDASMDRVYKTFKFTKRRSPTFSATVATSQIDLEDQLWQYRTQFEKLLEACLEVMQLLSLAGCHSSEKSAFRKCRHRLKLWGSGNYRQLVNDDTCEWNLGARTLMSSISLSLVDIALLLGR
jgi:hypothetical protein